MAKTNQAAEIRLENISKTFHDRARGGAVHAVRPLDLEIKPGQLATLLGPSGCGKTTLLRMVAGFEEPTTGRIIIGGQDQTKVMANKRDIGFVFQNYALFPHMTVYDNVAYGLKLKGLPASQIREAVGDVLEMVGLTGMEKRFPNQISGGEQQRVALARVIVTRPKVLLFDEPLSNLDAKRRVQMRGEIKALQKMLSITSIYVTHDQEEALAISDQIVVMNKGTIEQVGTPWEVYSRPRSLFVANFVGTTNVLPAQVREVQGSTVAAEVQGRVFRVQTSISPAVGSQVYLLIRPEAAQIAAAPGEEDLVGTVKGVTYLGEKVEYDLEVLGQDFKVVVADPQRGTVFEPGAQVAVNIPEERLSVVDH
ncbi:MAG TPA: ABC transporter ATP-binding protein [Limnochordia bacterium]|nr:ABC transporter ATP-binding protein [Limnochordia bacterium]HPP73316.1 ABC transporter ATP-binding protein [Limnochordia bacterium]